MPPQSDEDEDHSALQELESSVINTTDPLLTAPPNVTPSKSKEPFSVLGRIPDDIEEFRERVFRLDEPASFDAATWEKYWPYIDNVWCLHNRLDAPISLAKGHTEKFWGGCRLQRKWDHTSSNPPPKGIRNRTRRPTGTCAAKFKLTVMPDGSRILERSTKDGHTHDMDHIDSIKRNSGVRSLVLDPFFNSWEPATIMAYLRDPDHFVNGRDMLTEAGGKYLERREIMNIFSQNLRKLYPGIDVSAIKKEQDKYKAMKTCNYKGCNRSFQDGKALMAHRKIDHPASEGRRHDHSHRQYTCPTKGCHRKKKSKGFPSLLALREHQLKMEHWGSGTYHTDEGPTPCPPVLEGETYEDLQAAVGVDEDMMDDTGKAMASHQPDDASPDPDSQHPDVSQLANASSSLSIPQQSLPATDNPLLPLLAAHGVQSLQQGNMLPIDPAMHSQPLQQQNLASELAQADDLQRQAMVARYQALQAEMAQLKNALSL